MESGSAGQGELSRPKSARARTVPMVEQIDHALTKPGGARARHAAGGSCLPGSEGGYIDSSALRRRYVAAPKRADLRALRFHHLSQMARAAPAGIGWRSGLRRA